MSIDWKAAALAARRADAAYIENTAEARAAFEQLGDTFIDQYQNGTHQAVLTADSAGRTQLSISGTRKLSLTALDLLDDIDLTPVLPDRTRPYRVARGAYEGLQEMWGWINETVDWRAVLDVQGHSLGGARTHFTPMFRAPQFVGRLHSFESPKFADSAYYAHFAEDLAHMVCTLNGRDPWAAWPWVGGLYGRPQQQHAWLMEVGFDMLDPKDWVSGNALVFSGDHSMSLVADRISTIAEKS
jgi:hypothetical protein